MGNNKARELVNDVTTTEYLLNCCGAPLYNFNNGGGRSRIPLFSLT